MTLFRKQLLMLILMLTASGLAAALRPTDLLAKHQAPFDLQALIPNAFADWREEPQALAMVVDPQQQELIGRIYKQTLSRTYVNSKGERVMLSLAYGEDQRDSMQLHYPEVCYPAQGFVLEANQAGMLATGYGEIPVRRLITANGNRTEPITYWTLIGDRVVLGGISSKLVQMSYGLKGFIPDGLLFRVSSINGDATAAYRLQENYVRSLMAAMPLSSRSRLIGNMQSTH